MRYGLLATALVGVAGVMASVSMGEPGAGHAGGRLGDGGPVLRVAGGVTEATLYATGERVESASEEVWRLMCGSAGGAGVTVEDLVRIRDGHLADMRREGVVVVDTPRDRAGDGDGGGVNVVFNLGSSVPAAAIPSFALAEQYMESIWNDPITVTVSVSFASLSPGVIGSTGSNYQTATYAASRQGLVQNRDPDDVIQTSLPQGSTVPVRYVGSSLTVTQEGTVFWTRANFRSTVGAVAGSDASMTYSTNFSFDFDPSNGVVGTSLVDVIIHEVGHAMGFTSGADFRVNDLEAIDLFRFGRGLRQGQRVNPDTLEEFGTFAREVDNNDPTNDDVISDLILPGLANGYRMSDGNPRQASHFFDDNQNIMDPTIGGGFTYFPNYYRAGDLQLFDAIGWDRGTGCLLEIVSDPPNVSVTEGQTANLSVGVSGNPTITFQWRRNGVNVVDGGRITGASSSSLQITPVEPGDQGNYDVVVVNPCGTATSGAGTLTVIAACVGDANGDREVNFFDLNIVLGQFGQSGAGLGGDVNGDGFVNFFDLNIVLGAFGTVCP